jgi:hydrophobic/amphiphilic exporter-1 (mainly G- bacteria), HAE1 family
LKYSIQMEGRLSTVEEFENIIIRENPNGSLVKIKNIARVDLGSESYSALAYKDNKPCALIVVYQRPGSNAVQVSRAVKKKLNQLSEYFPEDLTCTINFSVTKYINASIKSVILTLVIAVILVLLIVFIFLQDWRSTMIPMVAIPVSLIGTFAGLLAFGCSINTITLFGLILATGIVVDDAIVVIENVHRIMKQEGLESYDATVKSMSQVTSPIIATTFVLMAVFVPVAFIPGITGHLYRQFAITIIIAVLISAFNALTLTPPLCAIFLKKERSKTFFLFKWFNKFFSSLTVRYNKNVEFLVKKVTIVIIFFIAIISLSIYLFEIVPRGFIPSEDQGYFFVNVQLPEGAALPRTDKIVKELAEMLEKTNGVDFVISVAGFSVLTGITTANTGLLCAILKDWDKRNSKDLHVESIIRKVNKKFQVISQANIVAFNVPPIRGLGTAGGFQFEILLNKSSGKTIQNLAEVMRSVLYEANQQPEIEIAYTAFQSKMPQIFVKVNREKARKLGIKMPDVFNTLQTFLGSTYVNEFNKFGKVYQVVVQAEEKFRRKIKTINGLYVRNDEGKMVPLGTLLTIKPIFGPAVINHYNMFTSIAIMGNAAEGYSSGQTITAMERVAKTVLPNGITYDWTGTAYQEILAGNKAILIFIFALVVAYLFLVALYESLMIAFAVILSIPVAIFGALGAIWLTGLTNNIYTQIGFVLLLGLACKTAILVVEFAKKEHENGKSIIESAKFAAKIRFRAVIMTSIAFILGVFPLVVATGAGASSSRSIGITVFGGMVLVAIFGTLVVPTFYVIIQRITEKKFRKTSKNER